ncbi:hypothetical protein XBI1_2280049 [Xenorhabdus bovienii str. Intermedium]|uniref:Uncharacterized protein n=1 Tax=Xenorhabdus bovienii str. Intermedium TaxID=1379677 RepID=A0A077QI43_XENBV|nr:hypothetical protein XBI1_2280049 [Xenorhabdus bovienii str. Intermedium]
MLKTLVLALFPLVFVNFFFLKIESYFKVNTYFELLVKITI